MAIANFSRRGLLRHLGLGAGGVALVGVSAACGTTSEHERREATKRLLQEQRAGAAATAQPATQTANHASHGATMVQASPRAGSSADEMDRHHEEGITSFPAKTKGIGGQPLAFEMDGDTKVFTLTCDAVRWEVRPEEYKDAFAYNGTLPGPEIRVTEGDRVRFVVTNNLPESTSVHWHGLRTPNGMDGVPFITQPPIKPGATFTYEFVAEPAGTHMYHSHHNAMEQVGKGLLGPFIIEPRDRSTYPAFDREYTIVLNDTLLGFTLNGKSFPATQPLKASLGERVLVRYLNEGLMNHPMHLHGMPMQVVAKDGYLLSSPYFCDNLDIAPGDRYEVIIEADNPGTWAFHCHTLSHAEAPTGMFGLVTVLIVDDPSKSSA
ncbi:MAG: multicopper oxidase family protein [Dehalococcoidia bacterium]